MKKRLYILAFAIIITVVSVIALLAKHSYKNKDNRLILKQHNRSVVLFRGNEIVKKYPEIVPDVLPEADKEMLRNGIVIESEEQLSSIIEDYDG